MASQNSRGTSLRNRRISPTFIRWETAWMISAASTASGQVGEQRRQRDER